MRTPLWIVVGLLGIGASQNREAAAEVHVDFLFGGGPYGYHHHHHHHHGYFGYHGWYYPRVDYVYVAPPPVTYVPVAPAVPVTSQYVAPRYDGAQSSTSTGPTLPTSSASTTAKPAGSVASPPTNASADYHGRGVTIRNPASTGARVAFLLDGRSELELAPGEVSLLRDKGRYVVEFDRGGDFGTARKELDEGTYEFSATSSGWDLQRTTSSSARGPEPLVRRNVLPSSSAR